MKWSLAGACHLQSDNPETNCSINLILKDLCGDVADDFNDVSNHAKVLKLLDRAIERYS